MTQKKTYKLSDVRIVCEQIYEKPICNSTWLRWKEHLSLPKSQRYCVESQMEQLITLANIKRRRPRTKTDIFEVIRSKQSELQDIKTRCFMVQQFLLPESCVGSELAEVLELASGRRLSQKTLYKWGLELKETYSVNSIYGKEAIQKFFLKIS